MCVIVLLRYCRDVNIYIRWKCSDITLTGIPYYPHIRSINQLWLPLLSNNNGHDRSYKVDSFQELVTWPLELVLFLYLKADLVSFWCQNLVIVLKGYFVIFHIKIWSLFKSDIFYYFISNFGRYLKGIFCNNFMSNFGLYFKGYFVLFWCQNLVVI